MRNLHRRFDRYYIGQIYSGDFAKFCGLRIYELTLSIYQVSQHDYVWFQNLERLRDSRSKLSDETICLLLQNQSLNFSREMSNGESENSKFKIVKKTQNLE